MFALAHSPRRRTSRLHESPRQGLWRSPTISLWCLRWTATSTEEEIHELQERLKILQTVKMAEDAAKIAVPRDGSLGVSENHQPNTQRL